MFVSLRFSEPALVGMSSLVGFDCFLQQLESQTPPSQHLRTASVDVNLYATIQPRCGQLAHQPLHKKNHVNPKNGAPPKKRQKLKKKNPPFLGFRIHPFFPRPVALPGPKLVQQTLVPTLAPAPGPAERLLFTEKSTEIEVSYSTWGVGLMALFLLQGRPL